MFRIFHMFQMPQLFSMFQMFQKFQMFRMFWMSQMVHMSQKVAKVDVQTLLLLEKSQLFPVEQYSFLLFLENKDFFVKPQTAHCDNFFNTFYQLSKSLSLGMKCVIDRQDFQIFCLKIILIHLSSGPLYIARVGCNFNYLIRRFKG